MAALTVPPPWRGPHRPAAWWVLALLARGLLALGFALPLLLAVPLALTEAASAPAWVALLDSPATLTAWGLSVFTALASTALALLITLCIITAWHGTPSWRRVAGALPAMLAVPHAAFAIGLAWLMAPAGWAARGCAVVLGWTEPPAWETVNDPAGLALTAVLVLKELPFLLWSAMALLVRPEVVDTLRREQAAARSLGYTPAAWWWRVGWLQWLPRLGWPLLAVMAYGLTVVDLGLIVGPGSPPTLAVLAWQDLGDASPARNAQGAAAATLLALTLAALVAAVVLLWRPLRRLGAGRAASGRRRVGAATALQGLARVAGPAVGLVYLAVLLSLLVLAMAGPWPFPALWPPSWSLQHGAQLLASGRTVSFTAGLAAAVAVGAVILSVAWFEATPAHWDARVMPLVLAPLVIPQLLLLIGLYRGALALRLDGSVIGLAWVHLLMVLPYTVAALAPAWRHFDRRYEWSALSLGRSRRTFWWRVKWPLLRAPLASALAIGFAVSVAQYLSTQFIGAGRHATLTTEAVTLASGGQRNLAAAFGLLQALLPALVFAAAAWAGRRHRAQAGPSA
jgi:putative thiamine transport system permease protein